MMMRAKDMFDEDVRAYQERGEYGLDRGLEELRQAILEGVSSKRAMTGLAIAWRAAKAAASTPE